MKEKIQYYLSQLEKEKNIEILLACETGSRAWGFPSPDSDYDVRIIYKHQLEWYLSLHEQKDTIELFLENKDIDISGWDIRKTLRLLWKSNPPLLERIQSPIIYKVNEAFITRIKSIALTTYSRIATIHHYASLAKKSLSTVTDQREYRLKSFFYALRASLACVWILDKEEIPPIEFHKLVDGLMLSSSLKNRIEELVALKSTISETYLHTEEQELIEYMNYCLERTNTESAKLTSSKGRMDDLNSFFREVIN